MKQSVSSAFLQYCRASGLVLYWKHYIRIVSDRTLSLTDGGAPWTEITGRVYGWDDPATQVEYQPGQFSTDVIQLEAAGIAWWAAKFAAVGASQWLEYKLTFQLGVGGAPAADELPMFTGFIDFRAQGTVVYRDKDDVVVMRVSSADDLAARIIAENISTQYINPDVYDNGTNTQGLVLMDMPGVHVLNANVTDYVLQAGIHKLYYQYDGTAATMRLDDGAPVTLQAGMVTLGNGHDDIADTQKLQVCGIGDYTVTDEREETLIVVTAGDTLPRQWYRRVGIKELLTKIYAQFGITALTFDTMTLPTAKGGRKVSFIDNPPKDNVYGFKYAITGDGTDLWMCVGNKLYKRTMATDTYTLKATLSLGEIVYKMWYNARNGEVWMFTSSGARKYNVAGNTVSAATAFAITPTMYTIELIDIQYTAGSYKYGLVYAVPDNTTGGKLQFIAGSTMTESTLVTGVTLNYDVTRGLMANFLYVRTDDHIRFVCQDNIGLFTYHDVSFGVGGAIVDNDQIASGIDDYQLACYDSGHGRIYYYAIDKTIRSHPQDDIAPTTHLTVENDAIGEPRCMHYSAAYNLVLFSYWNRFGNHPFYTISNTDPAVRSTYNAGYTTHTAMTTCNGVVYGIDYVGRLYQFTTTLRMFIEKADFEGSKVRDALTKVLTAYNLMGTVSMAKAGMIYRRGDGNGAPVSSGNSIAVIDSYTDTISQNMNDIAPVGWVHVSNGNVQHSYDGSVWDATVLASVVPFEMENSLLPDDIVEDVVYVLYKYFSKGGHNYPVEGSIYPVFHLEPFDSLAVTYSKNVQLSSSGVITRLVPHRDGSFSATIFVQNP